MDLRCEGRPEPDAIDVAHPTLSWALAAPPSVRARQQTAYHILVATSPGQLRPGAADRWDSGVVESSATIVSYHGSPLRSVERCYWAIRVRNEKGQWTEWEKSGAWSMGLLDPDREWTAPWIHAPQQAAAPANEDPTKRPLRVHPPDPWFRREIQLETVPDRAVALVASVGFHELYVNGRKIGEDVLVPNVCDGSKRAFYRRYDIASYLQRGANTLALWIGSGWSVYPYFQDPDRSVQSLVSGQFYFQTGAVTQLVTTDANWLTHESPNRLLGTWEFQNFGGELYDARAEIDDWAKPGLVTTDWKPALCSDVRIPLSADPAEPNRRQREIRPVSVNEPEPGVYRIDFGCHFAGVLEVALTGAPGTRIALEFSEVESVSMMYSLRSEYIIGPSGHGTFRNRFNYVAGRWLTLRGLSAPPDLAGVRAWHVRNDYRPAAVFECSSEQLNRILTATRWTFENLTIGGFVADCPHRERMGYGGDGHASVTTGLYHYRLDAFLGKWNRDWHHVQGHPPVWSSTFDPTAIEPAPSQHPGEMPYTAPTYWGGGGPAWSGICIHLPWQLYRFYGNRRVLEESLPVITRWLEFMATKVSDGLLRRWGGKWDFLGDWLPPGRKAGVNSDLHETLFFNNCYWAWSLGTAVKIARVLDRPDLLVRWETEVTHAREAIHATFYDPQKSSYADGSQVSLATALLAEIPPPSIRASIEKRLAAEIEEVKKGHIHAGITGGALLFHHLLDQHRHDLLHLIVGRREYPSWTYMLDHGATTFWESWEDPKTNMSRIHSSFLYVGTWPMAGVLGIAPVSDAPGFAKVRIYPGPIGAPDLTWARGHYDSIRGRIGVSWKSTDGDFTLDVTIPPGVEADVALPAIDPRTISESDRPLDQVPDLRAVRHDHGRTFVTIPSGVYRFRCALNRSADVKP